MNLEVLQQFCDVVRLNSFSEAAKLHKVTQSTISQSIKLLEKTLCTALIDRSKRPWQLNSEGKTAYREIRELSGRFDAWMPYPLVDAEDNLIKDRSSNIA